MLRDPNANQFDSKAPGVRSKSPFQAAHVGLGSSFGYLLGFRI